MPNIPTYIGTATGYEGIQVSSFPLSGFAVPACNNLYLLVSISYWNDVNYLLNSTGVSFGNQQMSLVCRDAHNNEFGGGTKETLEVWGLVNPATGERDIRAYTDRLDSREFCITAALFSGVNLSNPYQILGSGENSTSSGSLTIDTIASDSGRLEVGFFEAALANAMPSGFSSVINYGTLSNLVNRIATATGSIETGTRTWTYGLTTAATAIHLALSPLLVYSDIRTIKPAGQSGNYTSLSAWEAAAQGDLILANKIAIASIEGNWSGVPDTSVVILDGWTTGPDNYIHIRATGITPSGKWNPACYTLDVGSSPTACTVYENFSKFEHLQFTHTGNLNYNHTLQSQINEDGLMTVDSCIFKFTSTGQSNESTAVASQNDTGTIVVINCIAYGYSGGFSPAFYSFSRAKFSGLNLTAVNCDKGFGVRSDSVYWNCLAQNCITGFDGSSLNGGYNISDTPNIPGSNPQTGTVLFIAPSSQDYRLSPNDTLAKGKGVDLSAIFTDDIADKTRSIPWDIGASTFVAPTILLKTIAPSGQGANYLTLNAWEAGEQRNLVTGNFIAEACISGNWSNAETGTVTVDGWTTTGANYINIYTIGAARHSGAWNTGAYRLESGRVSEGILDVNSDNVRISGLQIKAVNTGTQTWGLRLGSAASFSYYLVGETILWADTKGSTALNLGIYISNTSNFLIRNCITYNWKNQSNLMAGVWSNGSGSLVNCSAYNCHYGFSRNQGTITAINCLANNCNDGFVGLDSGGSTGNCSDISGDAPGSGPIFASIQFDDPTGGNFRPSPFNKTGVLKGTGQYTLFTNDITGRDRGSGSIWTIGAFELGLDNNNIIWPTGDITTGNWTAPPLWSKINSDAADADMISSPYYPSNEMCEVKLSGLQNPNNNSGYYLVYRIQKSGTSLQTFSLNVELLNGATLVAEQTHSGIPTGWFNTGFFLTTGEAASITDYNNLRLRFTANTT